MGTGFSAVSSIVNKNLNTGLTKNTEGLNSLNLTMPTSENMKANLKANLKDLTAVENNTNLTTSSGPVTTPGPVPVAGGGKSKKSKKQSKKQSNKKQNKSKRNKAKKQ